MCLMCFDVFDDLCSMCFDVLILVYLMCLTCLMCFDVTYGEMRGTVLFLLLYR